MTRRRFRDMPHWAYATRLERCLYVVLRMLRPLFYVAIMGISGGMELWDRIRRTES